MSYARKLIRRWQLLRIVIKFIGFYYSVSKKFLKICCNVEHFRHPSVPNVPSLRRQTVKIFGWYGTETVGDKFILLGILYGLFRSTNMGAKPLDVHLLSMSTALTTNSIAEIDAFLLEFCIDNGLRDWIHSSVQVVPDSRLLDVRENDCYLLGGGPLMDDPILVKWAALRRKIQQTRNARFVVCGNGIGPANRILSRYLIKQIVLDADLVLLRNRPSFELGRYELVLDPAFLTKELIADYQHGNEQKKYLAAVNIRTVPYQYLPDGRSEDRNIVEAMAQYLNSLINKFGKKNKLITAFSNHEMEAVTDTEMSHALSERIEGSILDFHKNTMSSVFSCARNSEYVVSARFHGIVIGLLAGSKVVGLDYSEWGKGTQLYETFHRSPPKSRAFRFEGVYQEDILTQDDVEMLFSSLAQPYFKGLSEVLK